MVDEHSGQMVGAALPLVAVRVCFVWALAACSAGPERLADGTDSTAVMLDRAIKTLDHRATFVGDPLLVARLEQQTESGSAGSFELRKRLASALLRVGRTEEAIHLIERLAREVDAGLAEAGHAPELERVSAVAHLRRAEEQNCIARHNCDSCVYPITTEARHCDPGSARAAAAAWRRELERDPEDVTARWLFNLMHMSLGQHPDHVAPQWRIAPPVDERVADLAAFRDRAGEFGVAVPDISGGCVMDDFDGDGRLDILASSMYPLEQGAGQLRLFRNIGGARGFEEVTRQAGLDGMRGGLNLVQADYDNDGDLDVFILRGAWKLDAGRWPNTLLRNRGNGVFDDVTVAAGLLAFEPTQVGVWGDFDGDGWVDLFVGNETAVPVLLDDPVHQWFADLFIGIDHALGSTTGGHLYRNNRDGTFTDVAEPAGLDLYGWIKGAAFGDYDNDGDLDLFVSRFAKPDQLYQNRGDGTFTDVSIHAGVAGQMLSFATWFWDYDNDEDLDLFVAGFPYPEFDFPEDAPVAVDWSPAAELTEFLGGRVRDSRAARARLYENRGDGTFVDVAPTVGLDSVMSVMGANYDDIDGDGALDLMLGTGAPEFEYLVPNRVFLQRDRVFVDASIPLRASHLQKGHGIAFGDYDGDGDQDAYVVLGGAYVADGFPNALLENPGYGHRSLTLQLEGVRSNRSAIGARLTVCVEDRDGRSRTLHRVVGSGGSFGASSLQQEIGVGDAERVVEVRVDWPGRIGVTQAWPGSAFRFGSTYRLREGQAAAAP